MNHYPFSEIPFSELRAGDAFTFSGALYTGRDRLHKYLAEGGELPPGIDLRTAALYHCGPVVVREGGSWRVIAAGPTTSSREEPYEAALIARYGIQAVIGKGGMGEATRRACEAHTCLYLQAVGGAAASLAACVKRVTSVHFLEEFGAAEALWRFEVERFPVIVGMDAHGASLYETIRAQSAQRLKELL